MSLVVNITQLNNISQLLKVVTDEVNVPILTFDQGTGLVASPYLSNRMLAIIQERVEDLLAAITPADVPTLLAILGGMVVVADLTGTISPLLGTDAGVTTLSLTGYGENLPTYSVVSVPHSIAPFNAPSLL